MYANRTMNIKMHVKRSLLLLLAIALTAPSAGAQVAKGADTTDLAKLKRTAISIPAGSPVQVQMKDKTKVSGRIGAVDNGGFDLQYVENGQIVTKKVAFEEISKLTAGAPKSGYQAMITPVMRILTLVGTVAALTAAIK